MYQPEIRHLRTLVALRDTGSLVAACREHMITPTGACRCSTARAASARYEANGSPVAAA